MRLALFQPCITVNNGGQRHANGDSFGLAAGYGGGSSLQRVLLCHVAGVAHWGSVTAFLSGSSLYGNGDNFTLYANSTQQHQSRLKVPWYLAPSGIVTIQNNGLFF